LSFFFGFSLTPASLPPSPPRRPLRFFHFIRGLLRPGHRLSCLFFRFLHLSVVLPPSSFHSAAPKRGLCCRPCCSFSPSAPGALLSPQFKQPRLLGTSELRLFGLAISGLLRHLACSFRGLAPPLRLPDLDWPFTCTYWIDFFGAEV